MNKKQFGRQTLVHLLSAVIGGLIVISALQLSPALRTKLSGDQNQRQYKERIYDDILNKQESIRREFNNLFGEDFTAQNDPFEEMKQMRAQMEKRIHGSEGNGHNLANPFDSWFSKTFGGGSINDIAKKEDGNFVYYEIKVNDVNSTSINTKVEKGYVTINGTIEKKAGSRENSDSGLVEDVFRSSFNRTFPLPENVDQNKMKMLTEKDKVILKFPKIKA